MILTVCPAVTDDGALYSPLSEIVPIKGRIDHSTSLLLVPLTLALNFCFFPAETPASGGSTATSTLESNVIVALADLNGADLVVAVILTVSPTGIEAGAR